MSSKSIYWLALIIFSLSFVNISIALDAPPSPAGGNYLAFDGKDDFATLDFDTYGFLFKKETREFTVELWIYPDSNIDKTKPAVVLNQQIAIYVVSGKNPDYQWVKKDLDLKENELILVMQAYLVNDFSTGFIALPILANQWNYAIFQIENDNKVWVCNSLLESIPFGITSLDTDLSRLIKCEIIPNKDFNIGGYANHGKFLATFSGCIDELRISDIPRYDIKKAIPLPKRKLEVDENTIALWHFDESFRTMDFSDSSDNRRNLIGKNGITTGMLLAVNSLNKFTTTWALIKTK